MKKYRFVDVFLILFSISLTFFSAEYILRKLLFMDNEQFEALRDPSYYAVYLHDPNEDFFNEDYWKLNYLFNRSFDLEKPNPLLGWTGFFDRNTYDHWHVDTTGVKRPVLLFGDSFAMCIDSVECFEDFLNSDTLFSDSNHLYNYGVGGYGIDQIYLLIKETVRKYDDPVVIFSMLTTDLDRSMLKVRDAQKPYFEIINDKLELKGTPITLSSEEYFEQNPPEITSYLWNKFQNSVISKITDNEKETSEYIRDIKRLNDKILENAFEELRTLNTNFIVLLFQPAWVSGPDWRLDFLKETCEKYNVPYICDADIRNEAMISFGYDPLSYYIPGDGHPTSLANSLIASEIKMFVLDSLYLTSLRERQMRGNGMALKRQHYRESILKNEEWLNSVKEKAKAKGISLDSMLNLDVEYLIRQEEKHN